MAHFTVGDLRSKLGGRQAPVEDDQPGAGARASEQGEIEVEAVLPHEADQLAGACDAVREIIGNPRAGAVELGKVDDTCGGAECGTARVVPRPIFGILAKTTDFRKEPHVTSPRIRARAPRSTPDTPPRPRGFRTLRLAPALP